MTSKSINLIIKKLIFIFKISLENIMYPYYTQRTFSYVFYFLILTFINYF